MVLFITQNGQKDKGKTKICKCTALLYFLDEGLFRSCRGNKPQVFKGQWSHLKMSVALNQTCFSSGNCIATNMLTLSI